MTLPIPDFAEAIRIAGGSALVLSVVAAVFGLAVFARLIINMTGND